MGEEGRGRGVEDGSGGCCVEAEGGDLQVEEVEAVGDVVGDVDQLGDGALEGVLSRGGLVVLGVPEEVVCGESAVVFLAVDRGQIDEQVLDLLASDPGHGVE